jgi:FkbM family methyltransferase
MDKRLIHFLIKRPASWLACFQTVMAILLRKPHVLTRRNGVVIRTKVGNGEGLFCAVAGTEYEPEMRWFLDQMKPNQCFVDVGANVGIYSLHASRRIGKEGKVYAFEPTPETFEILNTNIQLNRLNHIHTFMLALSDKNGSLELVMGDRPASNSVATQSDKTSESTTIEAVTLDHFCSTHAVKKIDFVKVDIEGGEHDFFVGAKEILQRDKPIILFESMHTGPTYPERTFLIDLGYQLHHLESNRLIPLSKKTGKVENLIAIHPQQ